MKKLFFTSLVCVLLMAQSVYADVSIVGDNDCLSYSHWLPKRAYICFHYNPDGKITGYRVSFQLNDSRLFREWKMKKSNGGEKTFPFILESTLIIEDKGEVERTGNWGFGRLDGNNSNTPSAYLDSTFSDFGEDNYGIGILKPHNLQMDEVHDYWVELAEADHFHPRDPKTLKVNLRFRLNIDLSAAKKFGYTKNEINRDFELGDGWTGSSSNDYGYDNANISKNYSAEQIGKYFSFAIESRKGSSYLTYSYYFVLDGMDGQWCKERNGNAYQVGSLEECLNDPSVLGKSWYWEDIYTPPADGSNESGGDPDFVVREVYVDHHKKVLRPDEDIEIFTRVKNKGDGESPEDIRIKYWRSDGEHVDPKDDRRNLGTDNIKKENLLPGESKWESKHAKASSTPGTYNYTVEADYGDDIDELHESNNLSDEYVVEVKKPQLFFSSFYIIGGAITFDPGEMIPIKAYTDNTGAEPGSDVKLHYYLDDVKIGEDNMRNYNLEPEDPPKEENIYIAAPQTPGIHTIAARIDPSDNVDESNENDNYRSVSFEVLEPEPIPNPNAPGMPSDFFMQ